MNGVRIAQTPPPEHRPRPRTSWPLLALAALLALGACEQLERLRETPRERYARRLRDAGLDSTALGRDWLAAGERALASPRAVALPAGDSGTFDARGAPAVALHFAARRGQRVVVDVARDTTVERYAVFVDLFAAGDSTRPPRRVASADEAGRTLAFEPREDGAFVLRVQPELLRGGRYAVRVRAEPTLGFPVEGKDARAIGSAFGADRDGGRRRHQGVDIFAPRGTPAVAATGGFVSSTAPNRLGGNVVWLLDPDRRQVLYYAHLDRVVVHAGERVGRGDTLGFVGNTGNAATTPAHLHFGIYVAGEGAVDPRPYIARDSGLGRVHAAGGRVDSNVRREDRSGVKGARGGR
jgi:murein DD-endopeptidase MepM/ murein hydrolase activator NlpD